MSKLTQLAATITLAAALAAPAVAAPETYVLDSAHSFPRFSYNRLANCTRSRS